MHWYLEVLRRFADFSGRSSRREYWTFTLVNALVLSVWVVGIAVATGRETLNLVVAPLGILYMLALFIPALAARVRRLHDTGRSGWWLLFAAVPLVGPIVVLVFLCQGSQPGANEYGPSPDDVGAARLAPGAATA